MRRITGKTSTRRMPPANDLRPRQPQSPFGTSRWVERALEKTTHRHFGYRQFRVLSMASKKPLPTNFGCMLPSPILLQPVRDCEGFVHSASLEGSARTNCPQNFRGDAAFAKPDIYEYLEEKGFLYAIRLPANEVLQAEIRHLLTRPAGRPPRKPIAWFADFRYQAASWDRPRRVIAKVEWHTLSESGFHCDQYERTSARGGSLPGRGTAEPKYALNWTAGTRSGVVCLGLQPGQLPAASGPS